MFGGESLSHLGPFSHELPDAGSFHRCLARWNQQRLSPHSPTSEWHEGVQKEARMKRLEGNFIEAFRERIATRVANVPQDADAFIVWFETLKDHGPGQWDPLFDWLEGAATLDELKWFLTQEAAGEAGFEDLVALTQVKVPDRAKLELARNYWDEMGRGNARGMHGAMLSRTTAMLGLNPTIDATLWQSLCLSNTMTAFATTRRYTWHSIGALGVVELTAPTRVSCVNAGLKRVGVAADARKYFALHAQLDIEHSRAWNAEVLYPLIAEDPLRAQYIAEGAVMRLICGEQCFAAYRAHLWAGAQELAYAAE